MSVVVAIKDKDNIYLGADSQVTRGGSRISLLNPNNYKVWSVKNAPNTIMGHVGFLRDACAVRVIPDLLNEIDIIHDNINFDYMVNRVEPYIMDTLLDHKFINPDNPYKSLESRFVLAHKDKLFTIEYGSILEHDNFVAIGSSESEAIGSLLSTDKIKNPIKRIILAIKAAAAHDIYVDYPIIITNTKTEEFIVITEKNEKDYLKEE